MLTAATRQSHQPLKKISTNEEYAG